MSRIWGFVPICFLDGNLSKIMRENLVGKRSCRIGYSYVKSTTTYVHTYLHRLTVHLIKPLRSKRHHSYLHLNKSFRFAVLSKPKTPQKLTSAPCRPFRTKLIRKLLLRQLVVSTRPKVELLTASQGHSSHRNLCFKLKSNRVQAIEIYASSSNQVKAIDFKAASFDKIFSVALHAYVW
jgi:hypothetical protein